jgi:hypothetical protein
MRPDEVRRLINDILKEGFLRTGLLRSNLDDADGQTLERLKQQAPCRLIAGLHRPDGDDLTPVETRLILTDCVEAARDQRRDCRRIASDALELQRDAQEFRRALTKWADRLHNSALYIDEPNRVDEAMRTLYQATHSLEDRGRLMREGLTRRKDSVTARSRGIGWVKESVHALTGRPNHEAVMTLCDYALVRKAKTTLEEVKSALGPAARRAKARRQRGH